MKLAFVIFRYFPYGGLQRDMLTLARHFNEHGHEITVFCERWDGEKFPAIKVVEIPSRGLFNVAGVKCFVENFLAQYPRNNFEALIGFNKMPGLDVYFAGDTCFACKAYGERNWIYRLMPRTRLYLRYENAVFGEQSETKILSLVSAEQKAFTIFYGTAQARFHPLPPGIVAAHIACDDPATAYRELRIELGVAPNTKIILCLGSGFHTKGLDISIAAFTALQKKLANSILVIVGNDKPGKFYEQARRLGVEGKIFFLGPRSPIGNLLHGVDLLLHPARKELAGNVILEAMLCACPVLASDHCGYASYIVQYQMGDLIRAGATSSIIAQQSEVLLQQERSRWNAQAAILRRDSNVFARAECALAVIENIVQQKRISPDQNNFPEQKRAANGETVILRDELINQWRGENIFERIRDLSGTVAREMPDRQTLRFELDGQVYYRKWHRGVGWAEIIKNLVRLRLPVLGARNEWEALNKMRALGIPGLAPVAFGERGKNPARRQSFVITRELRDVIQLDHFFQNNEVAPTRKRVLISSVAAIARDLHAAGINHRDFYLCHFMLRTASVHCNEIAPDITLVDLHRAQLRTVVPERWRIKDIGSLLFSTLNLGFTRRDYYRFLILYFAQDLRSILREQSPLIQKIVTRARKTYKRDFGHWPDL